MYKVVSIQETVTTGDGNDNNVSTQVINYKLDGKGTTDTTKLEAEVMSVDSEQETLKISKLQICIGLAMLQ